jgi:hypothetical protein
VRPRWADFVIAALAWWAVLLSTSFGGEYALVLASAVSGALLLSLLATRVWRRR